MKHAIQNVLLCGVLAAYVCLVASGHAAEDQTAAQPDSQSEPPVTESGAKSADEVAKELANPNNSLASLTFRNQFRWYEGDLPGADNQSNYTLLFQPSFPFSLGETASGGKANLFIRPAIPFMVDQPTYDTSRQTFDGVTAIGDIGFDIGRGVTERNGLIKFVGMVGQLPTATDSDVASKELLLGPEFSLAKFEKWGVYGIFASHMWDVTGWGDESVSVSSPRPVLVLLPGGGWSVGTAPIMNYDWDSSEWTVPLNLSISKTVIIGKTPWRFGLEANYYVERPDAFGPEWMIGINITPVVPNFVESWVKGH